MIWVGNQNLLANRELSVAFLSWLWLAVLWVEMCICSINFLRDILHALNDMLGWTLVSHRLTSFVNKCQIFLDQRWPKTVCLLLHQVVVVLGILLNLPTHNILVSLYLWSSSVFLGNNKLTVDSHVLCIFTCWLYVLVCWDKRVELILLLMLAHDRPRLRHNLVNRNGRLGLSVNPRASSNGASLELTDKSVVVKSRVVESPLLWHSVLRVILVLSNIVDAWSVFQCAYVLA